MCFCFYIVFFSFGRLLLAGIARLAVLLVDKYTGDEKTQEYTRPVFEGFGLFAHEKIRHDETKNEVKNTDDERFNQDGRYHLLLG